MRKNKTIFLVIFLIFLSAQFFSQTDNPKMVDQEELELILKKSAEYCEKLSNSVLDFICSEIITENIDYGPPSFHLERNIYIYDYQLKRQGNSIDEQRILVEENGQKKNKANAQLKTKRFRHEHVVFGPIGLLGQKQQEIYEYKILEEVPYKGEKAVVLEATPIFPNEVNVLYGKIWIRKKDFNILKIEWN